MGDTLYQQDINISIPFEDKGEEDACNNCYDGILFQSGQRFY